MDHLIQPVEVAGALRCPIEESSYRATDGFLTNDIISGTNTADVSGVPYQWTLLTAPAYDIGVDGEISFGVMCGSSIEFNFLSTDSSTDPDYYIEVTLEADGVFYVLAALTQGAPDALEVTVSLADVACGSLIRLTATGVRADLIPGDTDGVLTLLANVMSIS